MLPVELLSVKTSEPVTEPVALGAKVIAAVQLLPPAKDVPQVLPASVKPLPLTATEAMLRAAAPVLLNVTACAALVAPTVALKVRVPGETVAVETGETAADTVKLWLTGVAAAKLLLPDCEAVMEQVPDARNVAVDPVTVQILVVVDV